LRKLSPEEMKAMNRWRRVLRDVRRSLSRVLPDASEDLLSTLVVDISDFWQIGEAHRLRVQKIKRMSSTRDRQKLARLLTDLVDVDLLWHLPYHARRMKRVIPVVIDKLEQRKKLTSVKA
jgi:hypothetical protein